VKLLRKTKKPVFLVANKIDDARQEPEAAALWNLGLGEPYPVSAIHGRGVADLLDEVMKVLPEVSAVAKGELGGPRRVAILGRPNVGKSSLLNKAAGEERVVVNELAGTTRDPWTRSSSSAASCGASSTPPASAAACTCSRAPTSTRRCARRPRSRRPKSPSSCSTSRSRSACRTSTSSTWCSSRAARSCSRSTSGTA
jgi:GTPase SAR1 family protein